MPSAENLILISETIPDFIVKRYEAEWIYCDALGDTQPRSDYTASLPSKAFTETELERLQNYAIFKRSFFFIPNLCFLFLATEAKSKEEKILKADRQNMYSASITAKSILELYKAAFSKTDPGRVDALSGQVLVFSVSHN